VQYVEAIAQVADLQRELAPQLVQLSRKLKRDASAFGDDASHTIGGAKKKCHARALVDNQSIDRVSCRQPSAHQVDIDDAHARLYVSARSIRQVILFVF